MPPRLAGLIASVALLFAVRPVSAQHRSGSSTRTQEPARTLRPQQAAAKATERRVALVIGNGAYAEGALRNPPNDARAMGEALRTLGFEVEVITDASRKRMLDAVREFGRKLTAGGVGLFYYAGHGMQVKGANYLIPVGVDIATEEDVQSEALDANTVLSRMDAAKNQANLVILDACRNNPFARSFRSGTRGLAQMEAPSGTFVAFATAPGSTASDGDGQNGLYTQHLLQSMKVPGLSVEDVFKRVRISVKQASRDQQVPWDSSSLTGEFFFKPGSPQDAAIEPAPVPAPVAVTRSLEGWIQWQTEFDAEIASLRTTLADPKATLDGKLKALLEAQGRWTENNPYSEKDDEHRAWLLEQVRPLALEDSKARFAKARSSFNAEGLLAWGTAEARHLGPLLTQDPKAKSWVQFLGSPALALGREPLVAPGTLNALPPIEQVLTKHIQAMGGVEALNQVRTFRVIERNIKPGSPKMTTFNLREWCAPNAIRTEIQFATDYGNDSKRQAIFGTTVLSNRMILASKEGQDWLARGNEGYTDDKFKPLELTTPTVQEKMLLKSLTDAGPPTYNWEGVLPRMLLEGASSGWQLIEEPFGDTRTPCYKIQYSPKPGMPGAVLSYWLDKNSYLIVAEQNEMSSPGVSGVTMTQKRYGKWLPVGGILLPHERTDILRRQGKESSNPHSLSYAVNLDLPDERFDLSKGFGPSPSALFEKP